MSLWYFAYGSNMHLSGLRSWLISRDGGVNGVEHAQKAILRGWRLRTNYFCVSRGTGAANIDSAPNCRVEGVLMRVTPSVRDLLRRKEGWPHCYEEVQVPVLSPVAEKVVTAFTYVVVPERRLSIDLPISADYRRTILQAATEFRFSHAYCRFLREFLIAIPQFVSVPLAVPNDRRVRRVRGSR